LATRFIRDTDDMPAYKAMAITKETTENAAYKALEHNPEFAGILQTIPYRHPAQLYEAICYLFVFMFLYSLYWKTDKKEKPGYLFGLFMVLLFVVRFFVEFFKKSQGGFEDSLGLLSTGQWLSLDRKSTRLNSSHVKISYAVFCLKKKKHIKQYR